MASKKILTHPKVRKLQRTLYQQAKRKPEWKAWSLYADLCRTEFIEEAMSRVLTNKGREGIDGYTVEELADGWETFRDQLQSELKEKRYRPSPVLRATILKKDGKERHLGIPTVKDRVVQTLLVILIGPIFEADFHDESYGYRPERSAKDAIESVSKNLYLGKTVAIEADLKAYFDTINHARLMRLVRRRVSDGSILTLVKAFLTAPIVERKNGKDKSLPKPKRGTPQGGVLSPLLANLYLDKLDYAVNNHDPRNVKMVRYADDFVILTKAHLAKPLLSRVDNWLTKAGLTLNLEKTKITDTGEGGKVKFLGFEAGERKGPRTGKRYIHVQPSQESMLRYRDKIRDELNHWTTWKNPKDAVERVNWITRGWGNYFSCGTCNSSFRDQNYFLNQRFRYWYRRKHKTRKGMKGLYTGCPPSLIEEIGLYTLPMKSYSR